MKYRPFFLVAVFWLGLASLADVASCQDAAADQIEPETEVRHAIQSYIAAYKARDVAQLVRHWAPEGIYISRSSGDQIVGHKALTREFATIFERDDVPQLSVETESIDFISPNVALERGTATATRSDNDIVRSTYSVVYTKRNGTWLIDRVTDEEVVVEVTNFDKLKALDWLVGDWTDERNGIKVESTCNWTNHKNYLSRTFKVTSDEGVASTGLQIIGWDPGNKTIRSWLFDSDGSFVSGTWTQRDDKWVVQSVATLAEGGQGSYTCMFSPLEDGKYAWQKINRVIDGELLPNIEEIIVERR